MKLCDVCHRHVRPGDGACPFCGRALRTAGAGRLGAVLLIGALEAACSERPIEESASDGTGTSTSTSTSTTTGPGTTSPTTSTTAGDATTTSAGSSGGGSSSSGEQSSSGDIDTSDSGCAFYGGCPTDFASTLECSTFAQDCPVGEKCTPFAGDGEDIDSTACRPVARDPGQPGQACGVAGSPKSGIDDCDVGALCWQVDPDTLTGTCTALCGGSPGDPECPADTTCVNFDDITFLCLPACDPLAPACAPDQVCVQNNFISDGSFACVPDVSGDGGAQFDACTFLNECDPGHTCLDSSLASECDPQSFGCCLAWCDLDMPVCAGAGAECVAWFEPEQAPPGHEDVGVCAVSP